MLALLLVAAALTSGLLLMPNPVHTPAAHAHTRADGDLKSYDRLSRCTATGFRPTELSLTT